ncbi:hypothetical protein HYC85_021468 [Camellia sinensis]|uniref:IST1-like protein n=1 Tax=Camellia sinensis TaxID=4442 RepID=A0A7J7GK81_CAMSI|nr:hypothetical protein HYC85_021468 [Camellia sinensis]
MENVDFGDLFCSKTCLNLAISRFKLLQNKRDRQLKLMRREIAQFLQAGQEAIARIRVEHVIREQNIWAAYEILEMFCEFVLARVPILDSQRQLGIWQWAFHCADEWCCLAVGLLLVSLPLFPATGGGGGGGGGGRIERGRGWWRYRKGECPSELREAVASIIFAGPRCSDVPDLLHIVEKLSVSAPSVEIKLNVLKDIAQEYNVEWDSSKTEAEFSKTPEDLLRDRHEWTKASIWWHTTFSSSLLEKAYMNIHLLTKHILSCQQQRKRGSNPINLQALTTSSPC